MAALILTGWAALAVLFVVLWLLQLRTRNATSVDAAWAVSLLLLAFYYAAAGEGDPMRRKLVAVLAILWAGRLSWFLYFHRVRGQREEDGRYRAMREHFGKRAQPFFFLFYQGQALVAVLFSLPVLAAMQGGGLDAWACAGLVVWAVAIVGEAVADDQLARWRSAPGNRGRTCRAGLWRYSRHPNYFFEWVHWWAYVLMGHGAPLTWLGPVLMLLFLFRLTGIPYTERQALKSRGDDYRAYQRTTSVFIPWFPRREER